jgi:hypothetical protein
VSAEPPKSAEPQTKPPATEWTVKNIVFALIGVGLGPSVVVLPFEALYFAGSAFGVGFRVALTNNWRGWLEPPIYASLIVWLVCAGGLVVVLAGKTMSVPTRAKVGKAIEKGLGVIVAAIMVGIILLTLIGSGWDNARKEYTPVENPDRTLAEGKAAIAKQGDAVAKLSDSARDLLTGLDKTENELANAKEEVTRTLTALSKQQAAVTDANKGLDELLKKQHELRLQQEEIDRFLNGRYVPTRAEMSRAAWVGYMVAFVLGFFVNLLSAWAWERFKRFRRPPAAPSPVTPPPATPPT